VNFFLKLDSRVRSRDSSFRWWRASTNSRRRTGNGSLRRSKGCRTTGDRMTSSGKIWNGSRAWSTRGGYRASQVRRRRPRNPKNRSDPSDKPGPLHQIRDLSGNQLDTLNDVVLDGPWRMSLKQERTKGTKGPANATREAATQQVGS
jgi:hypothetical protein